jgi:hypothetical protein
LGLTEFMVKMFPSVRTKSANIQRTPLNIRQHKER